MATSILSHVVPCNLCGTLRTITDNTTYYTVEACTGCTGQDGCGAAFNLIDIDLATAKPPWKTGTEGIP